MNLCIIEGCGKPRYGHGWCSMHWQRWRKTGDPLKVRKPRVNSGSFTKGDPRIKLGLPASKTPEAMAKNAASKKGKPLSEETKAKLKGRTPWNKGKTHSEATRAKIRAARAQQVITPEHRQKISEGNRGRIHSPETLAKISGPNNYNWKGGKARSMSKRAWRKLRQQVLERDDHTCQECRKTNCQLVAHHIIPWPDGPDAIDNLISWCRSCHTRYHGLNP